MNESDHEVLQADQRKSEVNGAVPMAGAQHIDESIATDSEKSNSETNDVVANETSNALHTQDELHNHVTFNVDTGNVDKEEDKLPHQSESAKKRGRNQNVRGWLVVIASWIIMIPVAGTQASFGVLVGSLTEEFNATKLECGWIASLAFGFTVGTCPLSTPLITIFGARKLAGFGVISGTASLIATSFAPAIYLFFLTYSAMFGISANFIYNCAMTLTGQYFPSKHQALTTSLASAGISFGTVLMNPFSEYMVNEVGWRNTYRILAAMVLVVGLICICAFRPIKTPEQKVAKIKLASPKIRDQVPERALGSNRDLDKHAINESLQTCMESKISLATQGIKKNVFDKGMYDCSECSYFLFILWMLGTLFWSVSFLFPVIFLIDYMGAIGIDTQNGAIVMTAYGISEFLGRLLYATVADRLPFRLSYVYAVSGVLMGIANFLAPQGQSLETMHIYAIAIGVNAGILNSLMSATTMQLFGLAKGRHVWGYINVMLALGMVVGSVVAGLIFDATQSYEVAFYVGGCMSMVSAVNMFLLSVARRFCPVKEGEAVDKREQEIPPTKKSGGLRNSLRAALVRRSWRNAVTSQLSRLIGNLVLLTTSGS